MLSNVNAKAAVGHNPCQILEQDSTNLLALCQKIAQKIDFCIVNLVSDNYWSKCTGGNGLSLVALTFLMCGHIEH